MKIQRDGYIINVSSLGGKVAASFAGIYAASKFGLSGFSAAALRAGGHDAGLIRYPFQFLGVNVKGNQ